MCVDRTGELSHLVHNCVYPASRSNEHDSKWLECVTNILNRCGLCI